MQIMYIIGIFFLVLAVVFGSAARRQYLAAQSHWTPAAKAQKRTAVSFALVGVGLILWKLFMK